MAGDGAFAFMDEDFVVPISNLEVPAAEVGGFGYSHSGGCQQIYGHPFPDARNFALLDIQVGLLPGSPAKEPYLVPVEILNAVYFPGPGNPVPLFSGKRECNDACLVHGPSSIRASGRFVLIGFRAMRRVF